LRVLLVNPPRFQGIPVIREERCEITERYSVLEPYSLLQIGALLRQSGVEVRLADLNGFDQDYGELRKVLAAFKPEAVIFRFTPTTFDHDMRTASMVKDIERGIWTIGICWTLRTMPRSVLDQAPDLDFYVRQDYELVVPELVQALIERGDASAVKGLAFRKGEEVVANDPPSEPADYDLLPMPAFDLLPSLDPYFITAPAGKPFSIIYTSKGCPFHCSFCTVAGTPWKPKSADKVVEELRYLKNHYRLRTASFFDETFTLNRKRVESIAQALIDEDMEIHWYCNTRAHLVDEALLQRMHSAGCRGISYGIESGSQAILDLADKSLNVEQARRSILWSKQASIKVLCSFIIGLPGENWKTVSETIAFVKETLPTSAQFNVAVPYPGTGLYRQIYGENGSEVDFRLLYQDKAVAGTTEMTPAELNQARLLAYKALYLNPSWWLTNIMHVVKNPDDFELAFRYALKVANNYFLRGMENAH